MKYVRSGFLLLVDGDPGIFSGFENLEMILHKLIGENYCPKFY
jgi:hypothetical protein